MTIDPLSEQVISLTEAARLLPARRAGKRPHVSCIYRWTTSGCKGEVLESLQVGGTRCTSREALARFMDRLSLRGPAKPAPVRSPAARQRAVERAVRELEQAGA